MISASPVLPINTQRPEVWSENDTVLNGLNFIVSSTPFTPSNFPPSSSLPLRFYFTKVWTHFFVDGGKKKRETIKNMKSPSSQKIRHRKTSQSYDCIYQNWQVKSWLLSIYWLSHISLGEHSLIVVFSCTKQCCTATFTGQRRHTETVSMLQLTAVIMMYSAKCLNLILNWWFYQQPILFSRK